MQSATILAVEPRAFSPELALVDPDAAERARLALPRVVLFEDTLRRERPEYAVRQLFDEPEPAAAEVRPRSRALHTAALALAAGCAVAAAAYLAAPELRARVVDAGPATIPAARTAAETTPAPTIPAPPRTPAPPPPASSRTIPDFVWVASPGAAGYRIEFRTGTRLVFTARTKEPRLRIPAAKLAPGSYRWQVRRLDRHGVAVGRPLVDAAVTVD